jgi:TPR repeat protein
MILKIPAPAVAVAIAFLLAALPGNAAEAPANYPDAMRWYERAAGEGVADAQFLLGRMLETGRFRPRDTAAAAGWYEKAASQGHALAQFRLGTMYEAGFGVAADPATAARWYRKAAAQGMAEARFNLGQLLLESKERAAHIEAAVWLSRAADGGIEGAAAKRDEVLGELPAPDRAEVERRLRAKPN